MDEQMKQAALDFLLKTPVGEGLKKAVSVLGKVQRNMAALAEKRGEEPLTLLKCGTVLTLSIFERMLNRQDPRAFGKAEWASIAEEVAELAVCAPDEEYSIYVFRMYADYIEQSAELLEKHVSGSSVSAIRGCAETMRTLEEKFREGVISEPAYVESSLWAALEAVLKLLAAAGSIMAGEEAQELTQAVTSLAVDYARYRMYSREQALVTEYLLFQRELDTSLQEQYDAYMAQLKAAEREFLSLVEQAFEPDFSARLQGSVRLAEAAGVAEEEILHSLSDVDAFFNT